MNSGITCDAVRRLRRGYLQHEFEHHNQCTEPAEGLHRQHRGGGAADGEHDAGGERGAEARDARRLDRGLSVLQQRRTHVRLREGRGRWSEADREQRNEKERDEGGGPHLRPPRLEECSQQDEHAVQSKAHCQQRRRQPHGRDRQLEKRHPKERTAHRQPDDQQLEREQTERLSGGEGVRTREVEGHPHRQHLRKGKVGEEGRADGGSAQGAVSTHLIPSPIR